MEGTNFNNSDQIHAITTSEYSSLSSLSSPPLSFSSRLPPDGQEFPPTCLETRSNNDNQDRESAIVVPILTKSEVLSSKISLPEKVPESLHSPPSVILSSYPVTESAPSWIKHSTEIRSKKPEINTTNSRSSFWKKDEHSAGSVKDKIARFSSVENTEPLLQDFSKQSKIYKSSENISEDASNLYGKKNRLSKSCLCVNKIPNNQLDDQNTTKTNILYMTPKQPDGTKLNVSEKNESGFAKPTLNHAASFTAKSNVRMHTRSQSMLDMSSFDAPWNNSENRRLTLNNLIEQRRRGFSKLRGLVIPQNETHLVEPVLDLPEIKSKESNLLTVPRATDRSSKCNSLDLSTNSHYRSNSTNPQSPSWKNNTFTSNLPRYSPAFKRKCLQVYITEQTPTADSGNSSCSKTPDYVFQSDEDTLTSSVEKYDEVFTVSNNNRYGSEKLVASKSFDDKSSPSHSEINFDFSYHSTSEDKLSNSRPVGNGQSNSQQRMESHSFTTPKKCSQPRTKYESGRSEDDSDNDSAVSSSQSSYISRECSPLPSHIQDCTNNPSMMSSTDLAKSKDAYTLINNNGVAGRILKPQSVEAINRKNILASAKCRSGRDFKNGSPLIQRKLSRSENEKIKDCTNLAEENVEVEVSKHVSVLSYEESSEMKDVVDSHLSSVSNNANDEISNELTTDKNLNSMNINDVKEQVDNINTIEESDHASTENLNNIVELKINVTEKSPHKLHNNNLIEKLSRSEEQINLQTSNNDNQEPLVSVNERCIAIIETKQYSTETDNATTSPHERLTLPNYQESARSSETKLPLFRAKSSTDDNPPSRVSTSNVVLRNKYTFDKQERPSSMHIPTLARYDLNKRASVNDIRKQFEKFEMENQKSSSYTELKSSVKSPIKIVADLSPVIKSITNGDKIHQLKEDIKKEPSKLNESTSSAIPQEVKHSMKWYFYVCLHTVCLQDFNEIMTKVNEGLDKRSSTYINPDETIVVVLHRETTGGSIGITLTGGTDYEAKEITVIYFYIHN